MATLMIYRRAKGLCYKCGMKWSPGHKCYNTVALHVVEELWQMVHGGDINSEEPDEKSEDSDEDLMVISVDAVQGTEVGKTIRMIGDILGKEA